MFEAPTEYVGGSSVVMFFKVIDEEGEVFEFTVEDVGQEVGVFGYVWGTLKAIVLFPYEAVFVFTEVGGHIIPLCFCPHVGEGYFSVGDISEGVFVHICLPVIIPLVRVSTGQQFWGCYVQH
jgi:hypothetical protein